MIPLNTHVKIAALTSLLMMFPIQAAAQRSVKKPLPKSTVRTKPAATENRVSAISYEVKVGPDGKMGLAVLSGLEGQSIRSDQIKKALGDYAPVDAAHRVVISPTIVIKPDKDTKMMSVIEAARASRVSASSNVSVVTPNGVSLGIMPDPKFTENMVVKPNPLLLVLDLRADGHVYLNNDDQGSLNEPQKLISQLRNIFKERENNGVFRENSNEVEKTIHIRVPSDARFQRVIDIVGALTDASAGPLFLSVDGDAEFGV